MCARGWGGKFLKSIFRHPRVLRPITKKKNVFFSNRVKFHIFFTENKKILYFASSRSFLKKTPPKQEILGPEIHTNLTPKTGNRVF